MKFRIRVPMRMELTLEDCTVAPDPDWQRQMAANYDLIDVEMDSEPTQEQMEQIVKSYYEQNKGDSHVPHIQRHL